MLMIVSGMSWALWASILDYITHSSHDQYAFFHRRFKGYVPTRPTVHSDWGRAN